MLTTVELVGFGEVWAVGDRLLELKVALGVQERASRVEATIADPNHTIGARLIAHSVANQGIQSLPGDDIALGIPAINNTNDWGTIEQAIVSQALRDGITTREHLAYVLATAEHETGRGASFIELSDGTQYEGREDLGNIQAGDGPRYKGRGLAQLTGRGNYRRWGQILGIPLEEQPELASDLRYALPILTRGMRDGTFTGQSLGIIAPGTRPWSAARAILGGINPGAVGTLADRYLDSGRLDQLLGGNSAAIAEENKEKVEPAEAPDVPEDSFIKGSQIRVRWGGIEFLFYHQGTEVGNDGRTRLTGQSIRYLLAQRKKNKAENNTTLKTFAQNILGDRGIELDWRSEFDPQYEHLDQSGISDYQLLLREARRSGLVVSEDGNKLVITDVNNTADSAYIIRKGLNLLQFEVRDIPAVESAEGSSLLPQANKIGIDPYTGQIQSQLADVTQKEDDPSGTTGDTQDTTHGTQTAETAAIATVGRRKLTRIMALPSKWVIPTNATVLQLKPGTGIKIEGLPGQLSRYHFILELEHDLRTGKTTLETRSPVEAVVTEQPAATDAGSPQLVDGWFEPLNRPYVVTSPYGPRSGRLHAGADLVGNLNEPIFAMRSGTVIINQFDPGGYGWWVEIKHDNGYSTRYGHMVEQSGLAVGTVIQGGSQVGLVGSTGGSTGPHLHIEIRRNSSPMNPSTIGFDWSDGRQFN